MKIQSKSTRTTLAVAFSGLGLGLAGIAGAADGGTTKEIDRPPAWKEAKDVKVEDITPPGAAATYALFRNGKVYKVHARYKEEKVTKADGTVIDRVTEDPIDQSGIPPLDPNDQRAPTPEQVAEMEAIANPNPGPPGDPANMKAIVAANP